MSSQRSQAESQIESSSATTSPVQTVSEIYPDDSASQRAAKPDTRGSQDGESVFSLHPSDADSLYTVIDGRVFTAHSGTYMLPADEEEHRRLNMQHNILRIFLNGLFPFPELVEPLLRDGQAEPPHVLDVGAGSGQWALEMATTHPWAEIIAMDLVPPALISKDNIPSNLRFEIDDANLRMDHYANLFSVVHTRCMGTGLNDSNSFFYQVAQTLKRGGVLLMIEPSPQLRDQGLKPVPFVEPGQPGFVWFQYIWGQRQIALWDRGSRIHKQWWKEWLETNPNFSEVRQRELDIPIGAWREGMTNPEAIASSMMAENLSNVLGSWRAILLHHGHPAEEVNLWIEECKRELKETRAHCYLRFVCLAAVRSQTPWQDLGDWTPPDEATREDIKGLDVRKPRKRRNQAEPGSSGAV